MAKRPLNLDSPPSKMKKDEPLSPSKISATDNHATVSGLLSTLSPMLKPSKYFDAELTDGDALMRVVGFDKSKLEKLKPFSDYQIPVTLRDRVIQRNKYKDALEIALKSHTKIEDSQMAFEIPNIKTAGSSIVSLSQIPSLPPHQRVTVQAKVLKVNAPQQVGRRFKQDVTIADETSKCILTLWDDHIGTIQANTSYQFNKLETRSYIGKVYLSFPSMPTFDTIDPVATKITTTDSASSDEDEDLICASIIGVKDMEIHHTCINCNKSITPNDEQTGVCHNCNITQKLTSKVTAKLIVKCGETKVHRMTQSELSQSQNLPVPK